jgi:MFS family permease
MRVWSAPMAAASRAGSASRLHNSAAHYHEARQALRTPGSWQSRYGLDWTNFFLADVQTGFGTFVAFYLADMGWSKGNVGLALTIGTLASVVTQIPGGALADAVRWKRTLVAIGIVMIGVAALILAFVPSIVPVFFAEVLHGTTGGIVTPAIGAISLGLVGRRAMSVRTGRNVRYSAAGHALTAGLMGAAGAYFSEGAIFIVAGILCVPALVALNFIRPQEIDYRQARNAAKQEGAGNTHIRDLLKNRRLILFTAALILFQLADASLLPLMGENLAGSIKQQSSLLMAGLIAVPQVIVALAAPWVGYHSEKKGRKPLLLIGFAVEPIRAGLLAVTSWYPFLVAAQILDGISGAIITVLTVVVIVDLTAKTGRFNLARGFVGATLGVAASISTLGSGYLSQLFGPLTAFLTISGVAGAAAALIWIFVSETKVANYDD